MDKLKAAHDIITHALPSVPFDGWTQPVLSQAAKEAGYKSTDAIRVFPGGAMDAVDHYFDMMDCAMLMALENYNLDSMKIRERVALCVRLWLEAQETHKEALRKALALQALPLNSHHGLKNLYHLVDDIWHAIGDTSTDFNFYTKRLMLAGVITTTTRFWLDDKSAGHELSWAFLDRRIEDVMKIEKAKSKLRSFFKAA